MKGGPALTAELTKRDSGQPFELVFEGVDYDPGTYYEIYVNLPGSPAVADPESPYFAGVIAPFVDPKHKEHVLRVNVRAVVDRLRAQGLLQGSALTWTFVPRGPVPPGGKPAPPVKARMRVGRLSLVTR
jgi:hypothetical protein